MANTVGEFGGGLGRLLAEDQNDTKHLMASHVPSVSDRIWRYWFGKEWYDQGGTSQCVVHAWEHYSSGNPHSHRALPKPVTGNLTEAYGWCQRNDEWPGEDYDGTSVRAGAKYLQSRGLISEYTWAWELDPIVYAILEVGPVVVGTNWYESMFWPDSRGNVTLSGNVVGGHAWLVDGINTERRMFRAKNSWGRQWGFNGFFYLPFDVMQRLIREDGEACLAVEIL